jgi:small subunit ribosomal protein S17
MSKRLVTGTVSSATGAKTIVVTHTTRETHPLYGKKYTRSRKFHAHDEKNQAKIGDIVVIEESRPISKTKTWVLARVIERGREMVEIKKTEVEEAAEARLAEKAAKKAEEKSADQLATTKSAEKTAKKPAAEKTPEIKEDSK